MSVGKAYLKVMGIIPPAQKFHVPDHINGIAAQAYFGGRAEIRIRQTPVPCVLTDFSSQYPTVNSLLGNPEVLAAESLSFDEATSEVRQFVENITLQDCFKPDYWKRMTFFALVKPDHDVFPVRAEYNQDGVTKNIGVNYFSSDEPVWKSGPGVVASKLLSVDGKAPVILKAIRMVPHGQQKGLRPTNLRGMVPVDPRKDDLFKVMVEQKQVYKESNPELSYFLKIAANSTSYGMFFELTPQKRFQPTEVKVFSGRHSHKQKVTTIEKAGEWYFPPIAALITSGAHLLLAMIERCIADKGGHWLFMDTDSVCIVASQHGGMVRCPGEPDGIKALSWKDVEGIAKRFESLNVYNKKLVPGSVLKIEKVNFHKSKQIELYGLAISAKRYVLYRYDAQENIVIVDAKAHGLGYLYPPKDGEAGDPDSDWIFRAWHSVLETCGLAIPRERPEWFPIPAMMRMTVSTPAVLGMLKGFTRPFNFLHIPLPFRSEYSENSAPLIMPFSTDREKWMNTKATDTRTGKSYSLYSGIDPTGRTRKLEVKCYGNVLGAYREHPEAKFVDREGNQCRNITQGLLKRSHIVANTHRYIGKETSRRWEQGDDLSMVDFRCAEYHNGKVVADKETVERIKTFGIRKLKRETGIDDKTITLIAKGKAVKPKTLRKIIKFLDERGSKATRFSSDSAKDLTDLRELCQVLDPSKDGKHIALLKKRIERLGTGRGSEYGGLPVRGIPRRKSICRCRNERSRLENSLSEKLKVKPK